MVFIDKIIKVIVIYECILIIFNVFFDCYMCGDFDVMIEKQIRGMEVFMFIGCNNCYFGFMFSDYKFYVFGVDEYFGFEDFDIGDGIYVF